MACTAPTTTCKNKTSHLRQAVLGLAVLQLHRADAAEVQEVAGVLLAAHPPLTAHLRLGTELLGLRAGGLRGLWSWRVIGEQRVAG